MKQDKEQNHNPNLQGADFGLFRDLAPPMEESYGIMVLKRSGVHDHLLQSHERAILMSRKSSNTSRRPTRMNKELLPKPKQKKEAHEMWTLSEHAETGWECQTHLELNLAR